MYIYVIRYDAAQVVVGELRYVCSDENTKEDLVTAAATRGIRDEKNEKNLGCCLLLSYRCAATAGQGTKRPERSLVIARAQWKLRLRLATRDSRLRARVEEPLTTHSNWLSLSPFAPNVSTRARRRFVKIVTDYCYPSMASQRWVKRREKKKCKLN